MPTTIPINEYRTYATMRPKTPPQIPRMTYSTILRRLKTTLLKRICRESFWDTSKRLTKRFGIAKMKLIASNCEYKIESMYCGSKKWNRYGAVTTYAIVTTAPKNAPWKILV